MLELARTAVHRGKHGKGLPRRFFAMMWPGGMFVAIPLVMTDTRGRLVAEEVIPAGTSISYYHSVPAGQYTENDPIVRHCLGALMARSDVQALFSDRTGPVKYFVLDVLDIMGVRVEV